MEKGQLLSIISPDHLTWEDRLFMLILKKKNQGCPLVWFCDSKIINISPKLVMTFVSLLPRGGKSQQYYAGTW